MKYFSMRSADRSAPYVDELLVNTIEDLREIPIESYSPGTTCIVITPSLRVFILDLDKQWQEI